jgi:hypothetical protein
MVGGMLILLCKRVPRPSPSSLGRNPGSEFGSMDVHGQAEVAMLVAQGVKTKDGVCAIPLMVVVEGLLHSAIVLDRRGAEALHDPTVKTLIVIAVLRVLAELPVESVCCGCSPVGVMSMDSGNRATVVFCGHSDAPDIVAFGERFSALLLGDSVRADFGRFRDEVQRVVHGAISSSITASEAFHALSLVGWRIFEGVDAARVSRFLRTRRST